MTVCIGALTLTGPSIVFGADTRVTYGSSPVGTNDQGGKQFPLPPYNCAAVIAGSTSECHDFIARLVQQFELFPAKERAPYREEVADAIDDARWQVFKPKINQALKADIGLTLAEWQKKFLPPEKFDFEAEEFGMRVIRNHPLNVSAIVGGFIEDNTVFFCAQGMRSIQSESSPGFHVIGSGSIPAMAQLNKRNQNLAYGLARTVFHLHESMLSAQKEKTVGPPGNYLVVTKDQPPMYVPADAPLLSRWVTHYRDRDTLPLDSPASTLAIQAVMQIALMPPYDRPLSESVAPLL
jgi:hypothetical protein